MRVTLLRRLFASASTKTPSLPLKRFYKEVTVAQIPAEQVRKATKALLPDSQRRVAALRLPNDLGQRWGVYLDGKLLKTPKKVILQLPSQAIALSIAAEWANQPKDRQFLPGLMPVTTLAMTATDIDPPHCREVLRYLETDTICYRAPFPEKLASTQEEIFAPIVEHVSSKYRFALDQTYGLGRIAHPEVTYKAAEAYIASLDGFTIAALDAAVCAAKSFCIGISLLDGFLDTAAAIRASRTEEDYQTDNWGEVFGGQDVDSSDLSIRLQSAWILSRLLSL